MTVLDAYSFFPRKPSIKTDIQETALKTIGAYNQ